MKDYSDKHPGRPYSVRWVIVLTGLPVQAQCFEDTAGDDPPAWVWVPECGFSTHLKNTYLTADEAWAEATRRAEEKYGQERKIRNEVYEAFAEYQVSLLPPAEDLNEWLGAVNDALGPELRGRHAFVDDAVRHVVIERQEAIETLAELTAMYDELLDRHATLQQQHDTAVERNSVLEARNTELLNRTDRLQRESDMALAANETLSRGLREQVNETESLRQSVRTLTTQRDQALEQERHKTEYYRAIVHGEHPEFHLVSGIPMPPWEFACTCVEGGIGRPVWNPNCSVHGNKAVQEADARRMEEDPDARLGGHDNPHPEP